MEVIKIPEQHVELLFIFPPLVGGAGQERCPVLRLEGGRWDTVMERGRKREWVEGGGSERLEGQRGMEH